MPNGHGLRKCVCGAYYVLAELIRQDKAEKSDLPDTIEVSPEELPHAISSARHAEVEIAARLDYWQQLNHTYRALYRAHREAEEAAWKADWEAANPDQRSWIQRLNKVPRRPKYVRPATDR